MLNRYRNTLLSLVATLAMSGCLSSTGPASAVSIEKTIFASSLGVNLAASTKTANGAYYRDITVGAGALVANGKVFDVRYTGWLSNGQQFDTNVGGAVLKFEPGVTNVIAGWHETIPGMRVGGKRQLIIPATLAYGSGGLGPIPGNAVTVFEVEIVAVN